MKRVKVGVFACGYEKITLYAREGHGGDFETIDDEHINPVFTIGMDVERFRYAWFALHHEAFEFCCTRAGARYVKTGELARDNGAYHFAMDHTLMSDISSKTADLMLEAGSKMREAYSEWIKNRKKQEKELQKAKKK